MTTLIQVRNVPEQTRRVLKSRAAARGESLNTYLLHLLEREASQPTVDEVLARARKRAWNLPVSSSDMVREVREEWEQHVMDRLDP